MSREKKHSGDLSKMPDAADTGSNKAEAPKPGAESAPEPPCYIVGIGASSGGQEALEQLFTTMPADCGLSFVVIMHLPPHGPSFLAEMLGRYTTMEVVTAEDGMPLLPDRVQVIPAGRVPSVDGGLLRLEDSGMPGETYHPIDHFFRTLAAQHRERAIAVILSGGGTDGASGVKRINEEAGIVLVQEPASAINPGMPRSAIATDAVDLVLPGEELPAKIAEIARGRCILPSRACRVATLAEDLDVIFGIVKARTGHDFSSYKQNTVMRRIERRMMVNDAAGLGRYVALLRENPQEAHALCQDILIGVTSFFRDPEAFEALRREIIPQLFAGRNAAEPVRIWHACCASGEEVYSMAMLIREYLSEQMLDAKVLIFASDIDEVSIAQARAGLYGDDIEADVGEERLKTFFTRSEGRWQVSKQLREMVVFAHHSLIKDPPFSKLDLLVCRNFLIYLNSDMQKRLIALFHQVLKPGGVLFLGASETVGRGSELFSAIDKNWKIFGRREGERRTDTLFPFSAPVRRPPASGRPTRPVEALEPDPGSVAERLLMERYSPPGVVVNEKYEVVHVSTRTNRFLEVPRGEPTRDILKMAREELRPALRAAIYKVFAERRQVTFRGVKLDEHGTETPVNVVVEPLDAPQHAGRLALVVFEPAVAAAVSPPVAGTAGAPMGEEGSREMLVRQLEEQLRVTHEQLQAVTEQLESSHEGFLSANEELMSINEEFQSANEELQSTNEELETSKEELHALNEELVTVNAELQGKVEELNQANGDMDNLLTSSGIATLFLDRHLNIKGFTPAVAAIFNLIRSDIGRPFRHFAGKIDWPTLRQDAETVLAGQPFAEREVTSLDLERCYLKRIFPYRTPEGRIEGIVVTLVDISEHKRLEERNEHLASFPQLNSNPVLEVDLTGKVIYCNPATDKALEKLGMSAEESAAFLPPDFDEIAGEWGGEEKAPLYREIVINGKVFAETILLIPRFDVVRIYCLDITKRKRAEEALQESEQGVRRKLESIISPEGDIGELELGDIIDTRSLQSLVDNFYELTRMPMGLLDLKGKVLVGVGWQDACTKFHRVNPETLAHCVESDLRLSAGVPHGQYRVYKCLNNMWDVATPVMIGDRQFGNLFMGQFFFDDEPIDYAFFRSQAREYGFDENEYIAALEAVPRLSRATLDTSMNFFMKLAGILSQMSYSNLKLARSLAERDTLMESLRESGERLSRAQQIAHLGSWELDLVNNRLSWSDEVYRIFGLEPQGFAASYEAFLEAVHPDDRVAVDAAYSGSLRQGRDSYEIEHRIVRKATGEFRIVHEKCEHFRDDSGRIVRSAGMVHDITEHKRVEEELQKIAARLDLLARNAGELLMSNSPQEVVDSLCKQVMAFLDCHAFFNFLVDEEAGRLHLNACAGIPDEERHKIEWLDYGVAVCGCAARDACRIVAEYIPNTADPRTELVKSYGIQAYACHPLMAQGRVLGTLSFGTRSRASFSDVDLSLMKAVADQVAIAMERKRVEEELRRARDAAEAANRAKRQFLANMSHELRTPMGGILGSIELVLNGPLELEQREHLDMADKSARSLLRILNDILDLSRVESGMISFEEKPFSLRECVSGAAAILSFEAERKGLKLFRSVAEDVPQFVAGDQMRLRQLLLNLIGNAVKFTEQGQVEVRVSAGGRTPDNRREITFTIKDTGIGIPEDKKGLVFNSFSQADDSDTRRYGGAGLGLAISREIAERMGGVITCESEEGRGSTFSFTVSLAEADAGRETVTLPFGPVAANSAASLAEEGQRPRLLVAEDEPINRSVFGTMLKMSKFEPEFATNGREAVEMWEKGGYDLIIMDVQMPLMDGLEATRTIREREQAAGGHTPILAMTAHAFREDADRCLKAGMDAYISKPIDMKKSIDMIRDLIAKNTPAV